MVFAIKRRFLYISALQCCILSVLLHYRAVCTCEPPWSIFWEDVDRQAEESLALAPPPLIVIINIITITIGIITIVQQQAKTSSAPLPTQFMVNLSKPIEKSSPKLHPELTQQQGTYYRCRKRKYFDSLKVLSSSSLSNMVYVVWAVVMLGDIHEGW